MLDNINSWERGFSESLRKSGCLLLIIVATIASNACKKGTAIEAPARPTADSLPEAETLYSQREDLLKVRQAIVALRQAQIGDPSNYEVAWRLAKYDYYLGSTSSNEAEKAKAFQDGIEAGKLAVKLEDNRPDGHFWLGANLGGEAQISTLAGLAAIEDIKSEMDRVLKIDERYEGGSAFMVLGQVYLQAPRLLGGDTGKAIESFEKGLKVVPGNIVMRWHLAQAYIAANRKEDARKQIETVLSMKPVPGYEPEDKRAIAECRRLLEKL